MALHAYAVLNIYIFAAMKNIPERKHGNTYLNLKILAAHIPGSTPPKLGSTTFLLNKIKKCMY